MNRSILILLIAFLDLMGTATTAQTLIVDPTNNRFLINEPSRKPRLDIIVRSLSEAEKKEIATVAVMDTVTRPVSSQVREGYHHVRLGRMAEQTMLIVRDAEQLADGFFFKVDGKRVSRYEANSQIASYQLGKLRCAAGPTLPFGKNTVTVSLHTSSGQTLGELRITLVYPKPELFYIYVNTDVRLSDTTKLRRLFHFFVRNKPTYSAPNAVPDSLSIAEHTMFFGFKKAYYDGKIQDTRILYRVGTDKPWIGTVKEMEPFVELEQKTENWTWLPDGRYDLQFAYTRSSPDYGTYPFTVDHHWLNSLAYNSQLLMFIPMAILVRPWLTALVLCLIVYFWFRARLRKSRNMARKANLELQAIQSQLNPHFVFNALGSLQGLINKHDIDRANTYLSGFSKLMRNTLHHSGTEMVPLTTEIANMENYIKLEQLRFDFKYQIRIDPQIANLQVEVPTLLIQPVVENAVKHGISRLGTNGILTLDFATTKSDIIITVQDNGSGYDQSVGTGGKGLTLTRERIKLLNKGGYTIDMKAFSDKTGTTVVFNLKKWI
ncbi:histidine kinase [Dyadobacter sp. CY261]|uniref:sensor histidine kinase n=1 Tax=Dyadobacter sp. CY261 TaxID=2907203 RepID=UPI001F195E3F|nr:histidine kinase [Dyadobacter sp. CY261]MCF0069760.1 histidine kinase [Dyadobacter sp. CY261]